MTSQANSWTADWNVDRQKNTGAHATYRAIVAQSPDRALAPETEKVIVAYSRDVLGSPVFAPWLRAYTAFRGEFREGWMPPNFLQRVVRPHVDASHRLSSAKTLSSRLVMSPLLPDRVSRVRGSWLDREGRPITREAARDIVFATQDVAFLKQDNIERGTGVLRIDKVGFDSTVDRMPGDFVVQELVRHNRFFDTWNATNVATLRLATFKPPGAAAELRAGYLRVGRAADPAVISGRSLRVPVDVRTGRMGTSATLPNWQQTDRHPDSGAPFAGEVVPRFDLLSATVRNLHDHLPHVAIIGWDVILDDSDRMVILEWNGNSPDIKFPEAATGPHFPELARRDWRETLAKRAEGGDAGPEPARDGQ